MGGALLVTCAQGALRVIECMKADVTRASRREAAATGEDAWHLHDCLKRGPKQLDHLGAGVEAIANPYGREIKR